MVSNYNMYQTRTYIFRMNWQVYIYITYIYRQISNISRTSVGLGYKLVDHSELVGAPPVGAAPATFLFST